MPKVTGAPTVYPKAPIVEAVIDIQVQLPEDADARLLQYVEQIKGSFPQMSALQMVVMNVLPDGHQSVERSSVGWRLVNATNDRILQVKRNGFTFSHMPPYTEWAVFEGEARPLWDMFAETCQPARIIRIALRYINRLRLPPGTVDLKKYLTIYPEVPAACEPIEGFLMQVQGGHPDIDPKCRSVITVANEPPTDPSFQPLVLDFDVFVETDMGPEDARCWALIDQMRDKKNDMFEAAITEDTRRTFK